MRLLGTSTLNPWLEQNHQGTCRRKIFENAMASYNRICFGWRNIGILNVTNLRSVLPRTRSVLLSCSEMPRTSVPAASQRRGYVSRRSTISTTSTHRHNRRERMLTTPQLGTFGRAKRKVEEMNNVIQESRRAGHH